MQRMLALMRMACAQKGRIARCCVLVVVVAVAVVLGVVVAGVMFAGLSKDHSHSQICSALQPDPLALRECAAA